MAKDFLRPPFSTSIYSHDHEFDAENTHQFQNKRQSAVTFSSWQRHAEAAPQTDSVADHQHASHVSGTEAHSSPNELLPTLFTTRAGKLENASNNTAEFLREDLSVDRLNEIHGWLWMVGRPQVARPLHRQLMINRKILVTEQMDLHLTWDDSYIHVKPLPRYLLSTGFWAEYLCHDENLYAAACGFLLSYSWLVRYESDFSVASRGDQTLALLPPEVTWERWHLLIQEVFQQLDARQGTDSSAGRRINRRYEYGELRLDRLNKIYQFAPLWWFKHLFRGYHHGYYRYGAFFSRNFAWLIIVFAYITVVLSAMQVGLALDGFKDNSALNGVAYGFSIFSMVLVVAVFSLVLVIFAVVVVYNLTVTFFAHRARIREKMALRRSHSTF